MISVVEPLVRTPVGLVAAVLKFSARAYSSEPGVVTRLVPLVGSLLPYTLVRLALSTIL